MSSELSKIICPKCGQVAQQVIHAETSVRKGWYCAHCHHFEPAILRERRISDGK